MSVLLMTKTMKITKADLKSRFDEYNRMYFEGKLSKPTFKLLTCKKPYGTYFPGKKAEIWVSRHIQEEEFLKEVLIHEMIHQYCYEYLRTCKMGIVQHGFRFHYVRWQLKKKYGLHIHVGPII